MPAVARAIARHCALVSTGRGAASGGTVGKSTNGALPARAGPGPGELRKVACGADTESERGAATLIALALVAVVVMAALVTADIGALAVARAQAQTAADLAALAAVTPTGDEPALARAEKIAAANGARMTRCTCEPMEAVVSVRRRVRLAPFGRVVEVRADARAILPTNGTQAAALGAVTTTATTDQVLAVTTSSATDRRS
jgi:secretion/DNA translocation related TadE-like protein